MACENFAKYEQEEVLEEFEVKQEYEEKILGQKLNIFQTLDVLDNLLDIALATTVNNEEQGVSWPCSEDSLVHCDMCKFKTQSNGDLERHKQVKHPGHLKLSRKFDTEKIQGFADKAPTNVLSIKWEQLDYNTLFTDP